MGLFDDVFDIVERVFDGGGAGDFIAPMIKVGADLIGGRNARRANDRAIEESQRGAAQRAADIRAGNARATERLDELIRQAAPGTQSLRDAAIADPGDLTPSQQRSLDTTRRNTAATLAASSLRGSGRAITASIRDVEAGAKAGFRDSNQQRADRAAGQLQQQVPGAIQAQAGLDAGTGQATGFAAQQVGSAGAAGTVANAENRGRTRGRALADISSIALDEIARRPRKSSFRETKVGSV